MTSKKDKKKSRKKPGASKSPEAEENEVDEEEQPIDDKDYDTSLETRQLARWIILASLILIVAGIFVYVIFFVD